MIIQNLTAETSHHTLEPLIPHDLAATGTQKSELPLENFKHSDVGRRSNTQIAELGPMNHLCRIPGCTPDDLLQPYSQAQKLGHDISQIDPDGIGCIRK